MVNIVGTIYWVVVKRQTGPGAGLLNWNPSSATGHGIFQAEILK